MSERLKFDEAADEACGGSSNAKSRVEVVSVNLTVNGQSRTIAIEPRTTLLDVLRDNLALTGTKKACDRGECGACTVHVDGRRVLSCMTLAAMQEGKRITTIEGLERNGTLHPLQSAFIEHDGFQCVYCTSGQICSPSWYPLLRYCLTQHHGNQRRQRWPRRCLETTCPRRQ